MLLHPFILQYVVNVSFFVCHVCIRLFKLWSNSFYFSLENVCDVMMTNIVLKTTSKLHKIICLFCCCCLIRFFHLLSKFFYSSSMKNLHFNYKWLLYVYFFFQMMYALCLFFFCICVCSFAFWIFCFSQYTFFCCNFWIINSFLFHYYFDFIGNYPILINL